MPAIHPHDSLSVISPEATIKDKIDLISYDGPKFFGDSRKGFKSYLSDKAKQSSLDVEFDEPPSSLPSNLDASIDEQTNDMNELLNFYRTRCGEFDHERREYIDRFAVIESSHETIHHLKWDLRMKNDELSDLQVAVSETNTSMFELKERLLTLQAENDALRIQEMEDRKRIQNLLALTQPVTEEVTFFRDCRPGRMTKFPSPSTHIRPVSPVERSLQSKSTRNSVNLNAECPNPYALASGQLKRQAARAETNAKSTPSCRTSPGMSHRTPPKQSRVLRTVYLPNEQAESLVRQVAMLKKQLAETTSLFQERLASLVNVQADSIEGTETDALKLSAQVKTLEATLEKTQDTLRCTTKDYLVTRHNAQEAERLAHEEIADTKAKCRHMNEERHEFRRRAQQETRSIRDAITEEGEMCTREFRKETLARESDLRILKEQYTAVQKTYTKRIQDLQAALAKAKSRYASLDTRRRLEVEGFANDTVALKRQLIKIESLYYYNTLGKTSSGLSSTSVHNAGDLQTELATLQQRFQRLERDMSTLEEEEARSN